MGLLNFRNLTATEATHLTNSLNAGKAFRAKLTVPKSHPPCAVMAGAAYSTPWAIQVADDLSDFTSGTTINVPGDTILAYVEMMAPASLHCTVYNTTKNHYEALQDAVTFEQATCGLGNCITGTSGATSTMISVVALFISVIIALLNVL